MKSLPLFHQLSGQPVIVLGNGEAAAAKRRLVERAGGVVVDSLEEGVKAGARLAFVAHDDGASVVRDVAQLRAAGLLVNAVDRPDLCDFTTPSVLDRDPVLIAFGTGGASAGLAKALRLRFEALLPADLGELARGLFAARTALRERWPNAGSRRRAIDSALAEGGALDPLREGSAANVSGWLSKSDHTIDDARIVTLMLTSDDPEDLTLRQARLLGEAGIIVHDKALSPRILARCRADAVRMLELPDPTPGTGLTVIITAP